MTGSYMRVCLPPVMRHEEVWLPDQAMVYICSIRKKGALCEYLHREEIDSDVIQHSFLTTPQKITTARLGELLGLKWRQSYLPRHMSTPVKDSATLLLLLGP